MLQTKTSHSHHFKTFLGFLLIFTLCTPPKKRSGNQIPKEAVFEKRKNLYTLDANGYRQQWLPNGTLVAKCEFKNGKLNGLCQTFTPEKQLASQGNYVNGFKDGVWKWFFPDGKLYTKQNHSHKKRRLYKQAPEQAQIGNENGFFFRYYPDGKLEVEGFYAAGYKDGYWKKYYRDGTTSYKGSYKSEQKIGLWQYYYPDGRLEIKEIYTQKHRLKQRTLYDPESNIICQLTEKENSCNSTLNLNKSKK
ncbi:MAG: hypothetical protein AAF518_00785 [Spirochaetota bacterium]